MIWPGSSSTLRHRLDKILARLGLPTKTANQQKPLTLASFGPGGSLVLQNRLSWSSGAGDGCH